MKKGFRSFVAYTTAVLLLLALTGCNGRTAGSADGIAVKTAVAGKHKLQTDVEVTGVLVPGQTANIAAKSGGQVKSIPVEVGNSVHAGDILLTLETKELSAQLQQAQAALKSVEDQAAQAKINLDAAEKAYASTRQVLNDQEIQAKINLDAAEKAYIRTRELANAGGMTKTQLEEAQSRYDLAKKQYEMAAVETGSSAQSQLLAAQSKIDLARKQYDVAVGSAREQAQAAVGVIAVQLDNATVTSPISGVVINKNIYPGEIASPGVTLLAVADISILKLKGTVSQEALPLLKNGQEMNISIDIYPGKSYKGQIDTLGPIAVGTGTYFPIEISVKNAGDLKAGVSARAALNVSTGEGVTVPVSAVVEGNGENYVFVVKDNRASKRVVGIGMRNDKEIEILKGLEAGEPVAVSNVGSLRDDMPVNAR